MKDRQVIMEGCVLWLRWLRASNLCSYQGHTRGTDQQPPDTLCGGSYSEEEEESSQQQPIYNNNNNLSIYLYIYMYTGYIYIYKTGDSDTSIHSRTYTGNNTNGRAAWCAVCQSSWSLSQHPRKPKSTRLKLNLSSSTQMTPNQSPVKALLLTDGVVWHGFILRDDGCL